MIGADELLIKLTHFSPSAITSDATEKKKEEFEVNTYLSFDISGTSAFSTLAQYLKHYIIMSNAS